MWVNCDLDVLNSTIIIAQMCIHQYQQKLIDLYNKHVKSHAFQAGDLVLRRVIENTADLEVGKFQPNWEGLYMIVRVRSVGLDTLNKLDGALMPRMWNVMHLKRYYQ